MSSVPPSKEEIVKILSQIQNPDKTAHIVSLGVIDAITITKQQIDITLQIEPKQAAKWVEIGKACETALQQFFPQYRTRAILTAHRAAGANSAPQMPQRPARKSILPPDVARIIAVASGKGGVGKSTIAVNLALGFAAQGWKTGLLDADIYGPSVPRLLGLRGQPVADGKTLQPMTGFGLKTMSMGYLVAEDTAMIWRGPMVISALEQMLRDVDWGRLDILVVDMPPGTGDAQLTMAQRVPLAGAVIVSTPQDIALIDVRKSVSMFRKVEVPILGLIENMSYFICPDCQNRHYIFAKGGGRKTSEALGIEALGEIPLTLEIRQFSDAGTPIVTKQPNHPQAKSFLTIARKIRQKLEIGTLSQTPSIEMV